MARPVSYTAGMDEKSRQQLALFRIAVLGPLVGARLEHGDLVEACREAAQRTWELPSGELVEVSARTIEEWHYLYQHGGFTALHPQARSDRGRPRFISEDLADLILRLKREKPRRSVKRIIRVLERAKKVPRGVLTKSTVHRLLKAHGASKRPVVGPGAERRSFIQEFAGDLWVGDGLRPRRLVIDQAGRPRKAILLSQIDDATRYVLHSFIAVSVGEDSVDQEYGFKQALLAHGRPRTYYVDRGPAYTAKSLRAICAELDVRLLHTQSRDAAAKGVIERWHRTWREEVEDELPDHPIPVAELVAKHDAWLGVEYHARKHDTTGRIPREHWLEQTEHLRPLPQGKSLDDVFLHRELRTVRKDGTVRFDGRLLEVRAELSGQVELRFDPSRPSVLPRVFVNDAFACDTVLLDRLANATRHRRRNVGPAAVPASPSGLDPLALIQAEHELRTRPLSGALSPEDVDDEIDSSEA
ncbi:MAG: helix-turn-helix domain-containing protein [Myxococcaceae bacterium]